MNFSKEVQEFILEGHKYYLPHVSVDCVVFGFHENQLKVLLLKMKNVNIWGLPGGFVRKEETADVAAQRILQERTGIREIFLQQFYTFTDPERNVGMKVEEFTKNLGFTIPAGNWFTQRAISIGYYALVEFSKVTPSIDILSEDCLWWDIDEVPDLIFDHKLIMEKALHTLRIQLNFQPVGYNLLPEKFTMPELQKLYETILGRPLDRRNFQKKMLSLGILERLEERKSVGPHKSPYFYRFHKRNYEQALQAGISFGF